MSKITTVRSSNGEFSIDGRGNIIVLKVKDLLSPDAIHLSRIVKFDVYEWMKYWNTIHLQACIDILDLAYWYKDGHGEPKYIAPDMVWRNEIAKTILGR